MSPFLKRTKIQQAGFTLLELLVVVGIMAIIAGAVISGFGGRGEDSVLRNAQISTARYEMQQLRKSLLNYQADNGGFPKADTGTDMRTSPADADFLFTRPSTASDWNAEYKTGWRGPYVSGGDSGLVDIGNTMTVSTSAYSGSGDPFVVTTAAATLQRGIPDPFDFRPVANNHADSSYSANCQLDTADANNQCVMDWRFLGQGNADDPHERLGRPYLLFDLNSTTNTARIVSMGPNGRYESAGASNKCTGQGDDLVLCL